MVYLWISRTVWRWKRTLRETGTSWVSLLSLLFDTFIKHSVNLFTIFRISITKSKETLLSFFSCLTNKKTRIVLHRARPSKEATYTKKKRFLEKNIHPKLPYESSQGSLIRCTIKGFLHYRSFLGVTPKCCWTSPLWTSRLWALFLHCRCVVAVVWGEPGFRGSLEGDHCIDKPISSAHAPPRTPSVATTLTHSGAQTNESQRVPVDN